MKKQLLFTAMAVACLSVSGLAQTKGTSALSFGINSNTTKTTYSSAEVKNTTNNFSLGYGYFVKDNAKVGVDLSYGHGKYENLNNPSNTLKSYGGNVSYQKYYPLYKTLYAYAGGKVGYFSTKEASSITNNNAEQKFNSNQYSLDANGGITWFVSKRFALETSLLSADIVYSSTKQENTPSMGANYSSEWTNFNFSSQGLINNLSFKIYILF